MSTQTRAEDAGVVEHQHIACAEIIRQLAKLAVLGARIGPVQDEQSRTIARGCGGLRDEFRRERVVEVSGAQGAKWGLEFGGKAAVGREWSEL